jgi:glycine/D-amino acid oxidase-like deaminating enzyme
VAVLGGGVAGLTAAHELAERGFAAGDYVSIDLATMEGANASARAAVNALLERTGSAAPLCTVTPLFRAPELEPLRRHDRVRHRLGLPNALDLG